MSGGGGIHALCDDHLAEILGRLPSESLLRCRAVCKTWRRIATDPSFLADHAARRPIEMISCKFSTLQVNRTPLSPTSSPPASHLLNLRQLAGDGSCSTFMIRYSVDGLLLLYQSTGLFVVCNPITRQWTNLPALAPHPCFTALTCGFYLHGPSGEYRLLCHCLEHDAAASPSNRWEDPKRYCHYVLSTAAGALPRRLPPSDPPPTNCFWGLDKRYGVPVAHRGILHWLQHPEAMSTSKILSFDTVSETFRLMSQPPERGGDTDTTTRSLMELDGELAVADMQGVASLDIWALQDYEAEIWTLRHRVEVPPPTRTSYYDVPVTPLPRIVVISLGAGAILIGEPYGVNVARLYHLKDKKLIKEVCFESMVPTFVTFKESCVSHAFFNSPRSPDVAYIDFSDYDHVR